MQNAKLRFFLPAILVLLVANIGLTSFVLLKKNPPIQSTAKYVEPSRIMKIVSDEIIKTLGEMNQIRMKELQALEEQINNLEAKKKVKGHLGKKEKKELEDKQAKYTKIAQNLQKEQKKQYETMFISKIQKINETLDSMSKKHGCTIEPTQLKQYFKTSIAENEDMTDALLSELGLTEEQKKEGKKS